jgi:hypothetical protein
MKRLFLILLSSVAMMVPSFAQTNVTPAQYLASQPKPNFAAGHHLPHLTKFSWPFSYELTAEMGTNWGYALDLGWATPDIVAQMSISNSMVAKLINLATNYPDKFVVTVEVWKTSDSFTNPPAGLYCTNSAGLFVDSTGTNFFSGNEYQKVFSPEGPEDYWASISDYQASFINVINSNVPIKIILNGGEYGLDVVGFGVQAWKQDPRVQASDIYSNMYNTNNTNGISWPHYVSRNKSRQIWPLTEKIRQYVPNRELYIFYNTGNEQARYVFPGYAPWREGTSDFWGYWSEYMNTNNDMINLEDYFTGPISWTNATGNTMFNTFDLLTRHLNGVGYNLTFLGKTNSYDWVSGGWSMTDTNVLAAIPRYMGFLKCLYTAGTVGAVAGYFSFPGNTNVGSIFGGSGFNASFPSNSPPHWLQQIVALGHVHALFSHLDNYILDGDLLSGPQHHFMASDQPAYEFTNTVADATARVLARKLRGQNQWIVTAWAAGGTNRNVTVTIPTIGALTVLAADSGSVYKVTMTGTNVQQTLLDEYASFPATPPIILTGAAKLSNGAFQFAFTNTPAVTNYIATNITTTITTNWSTRGPPRITGYTTNITTTVTTNTSENTVTILTTTNLLLPLTNWTVLGTLTDSPPGHFQFTDPQATNRPLRFYRVRSP